MNMMKGMLIFLKFKVKSQKSKVMRNIKIISLDAPTLLVDFLNEALYLSDTNDEYYDKVNFDELGDIELKIEFVEIRL